MHNILSTHLHEWTTRIYRGGKGILYVQRREGRKYPLKGEGEKRKYVLRKDTHIHGWPDRLYVKWPKRGALIFRPRIYLTTEIGRAQYIQHRRHFSPLYPEKWLLSSRGKQFIRDESAIFLQLLPTPAER